MRLRSLVRFGFFSLLNKSHIVCFFLGNSPASEFYMPTFRNTLYVPAYEDGTACSETSAYKIQTPGNYPEESIQHSVHGESLKSRKIMSLVI
jgi:hypothetical protein